MKKFAWAAAPSLAGAVAAATLMLASGCAGGSASTVAGPTTGAGVVAASGATAAGDATTTAASPAAAASVAPSGVTTLQPSAYLTPALALATPLLKLYPSASVHAGTASDAVYAIVDAETSGSVHYVDVYSVVFVCGAGIPDDCENSAGAPELRIPIAPDATFHIFGENMQPNRSTDFAGFRAAAAGRGGDFRDGNPLFEITVTAGQATGFKQVYTP